MYRRGLPPNMPRSGIYCLLPIAIPPTEQSAAAVGYFDKGSGMANDFAMIDRALDEVLVQLGGMVLTLASPQITRTGEERQALARSVNQYSVCAASSNVPRVKGLQAQLEESIRPQLRLVINR
jgi:hypothetical protein